MPSDNNHNDLENQLRRADADMERRIHAGEECLAEEYFKACPELAANVDTALDLIYTEFDAREQAGRPFPPESYYGRFPQWRHELERQFAIHKIDQPDATRVLRILGPDGQREQYQVLKEISQSPNGNLVKARHVRLNRLVAIKTFAGGDQGDAERFQLGAREQERLRHANILPVYDVGESEDGLPCFAMEFAEGGSLAQRIAGKPLPPKEAAQLVRTLAEAMSHAHGEGVVHRDLKPANVVLTADDTPKITDFGLARRVDAPHDQSTTGEILGTVPYMAPEQAGGRTHEVGPLCDVYALGAILYELLTGRPPFKGRTVVESLQQVLKQPPVRPRRLLHGVPPDLESICLKCLEKKPRRRYRSAQDLADDLGRWLDGKRPEAHARLARASRLLRRRPILNTAAALLLFEGIIASIIVPIVQYHLDPDRAVKDYLVELERGNAVTLIGETGEPRWKKWVIGEGNIVKPLANDSVFSVIAPPIHHGYVELLPVSRARGCRFRVQVRIENLERGEVGVFFTRTDFPVARGTEHCFCVLLISEFEGNLTPDISIRRRLVPQDTGAQKSAPRTPPRKRTPLPALRETQWREVRVEITADAVRGYVDEEFIGNVDRRRLAETFQSELNSVNGPPNNDASLKPTFPPAGGLGVFVRNGWVSFRNAVVEPLDD